MAQETYTAINDCTETRHTTHSGTEKKEKVYAVRRDRETSDRLWRPVIGRHNMSDFPDWQLNQELLSSAGHD